VKIRIAEANHFTTCWYNNRIGELFDVTREIGGVPPTFEVDVSHLQERGELTVDRAFVPQCDSEIMKDDQ